MSKNELPPPYKGSTGLGWVLFSILLVPGIVSAFGLEATRDQYGQGGLVGLMFVAPITSIIATVLLAKDKRSRGSPMHAPLAIVMFLAFLAASVALAFGCCVAITELA